MKYRVIDRPAVFTKGQKLQLSKEQIAAREHLLEVGKGGHVVVTARVMFKPGEEIGLSDDYASLPGSLKSVLTPAGAASKATRSKAKRRPAKTNKPGAEETVSTVSAGNTTSAATAAGNPNPDPDADNDED